jgi:small-conductance mechanosensitive channel
VLESFALARLFTVDGWTVLIYQFGPALVRAILLAIGTWIAARLARKSFDFAARRADAHARLLIGRIINITIIGLGVATILDTLGVPLTTFVTVLGVAGLGISLAMQDVLKSFVAGTFLLFERPFRIGDEIAVKDQRGVVENIGIRTTRLRNADNVQFIIPNAVVFAEVVQNRTNEIKVEPAQAAPSDADVPPQTPAESPASTAAATTADVPPLSPVTAPVSGTPGSSPPGPAAPTTPAGSVPPAR